MENIYVCGVFVEIVEVFEHHVLVQDPATMAVFLVEYQNITPGGAVKYNDRDDSNVISLKGWKRWAGKAKDSGKRSRQGPPEAKSKLLPMVR